MDMLKRVHQGNTGGNQVPFVNGNQVPNTQVNGVHDARRNDINGNGVADIAYRLGDIDLEDSDSVWEKLTEQEREMFQKSVSKGEMSFLPTWTPWWKSERMKIEEVNSKKSSKRTVPKIVKDLPKLEDVLQEKSPDSNLRFCLIELLLTYCCMMRVFLGDLYDNPTETVSLLYYLSEVISDNKVYSDVNSCVHGFINTVLNAHDLRIDPVQDCLHDVLLILDSDDSYILRALSDFYVYLKKCSKHMKKDNQQLSRRLFVTSKKVYFYLLYSVTYETDIKGLSPHVRTTREVLLKERDLVMKQKEFIEENYEKLKPGPRKQEGKKLIEEI